MASVAVTCPVCRRVGSHLPPELPCACGMPVVLPLVDGGMGEPVERHDWDEEWLAVRCVACARTTRWPRPEYGCPCGALLRLAVDEGEEPGSVPLARQPGTPAPIRSARDAVTAAALHLGRLGHGEIHRAAQPAPAGVALAARGLLAHVEPSRRRLTVRDVECLWLAALATGADPVGFTRGGPGPEAAASAERLGVPLFALEATGLVRPLNEAAERLGHR
ncbi:hypothetical protein [Streptomyces sp. NRRL F-5630]|uniref:hypothetical protein n=1 Tax=Streptomyces sp. NRRL F-5630 TaxID=1463864 RepID=UPI003D73FE9D